MAGIVKAERFGLQSQPSRTGFGFDANGLNFGGDNASAEVELEYTYCDEGQHFSKPDPSEIKEATIRLLGERTTLPQSEKMPQSMRPQWLDQKSTRLNSSHLRRSRMPSSA